LTENNNVLNRRNTGGVTANKNVQGPSGRSHTEVVTDILVIGGGYAGIFAAIKAREAGKQVTIVEKGTIFKSGLSPFAGGFRYFSKSENDAKELWEGSSQVGNYVSNKDYYDMWVENSEAIYEELKSWNFFIPQDKEYRNIARRKVLQSGANAIERTMITHLIKEGDRIAGAAGFSIDTEELIVIKAKAVILCSGAGSFKSPGFYSNSLTSDGDSMAYRIGAEITGKEYVDVHPTHWDDPAASHENWRTHVNGSPDPGIADLDGNLNLGLTLLAHTEGAPVTVKMGGPPPGGDKKVQAEGGRGEGARGPQGIRDVNLPIVGGSSAGLSVHKAEGLFPADDKCASNIPGLFAAGDALGSMLCGGIYSLGGSATSGSAVQGAQAGKSAAAYVSNIKQPCIEEEKLERVKTEIVAPRVREKGYSPAWVTQVLQGLMIPYYVLYVKKEDRLKAVLTQIEFLRDHFADKLIAKDAHGLRLAHETRNMLLNAEMKLRASLFRTESRGTHYREDYPARDDENWLAWIKIKNENDEMVLSKVEVPKEWRPSANMSYEERYPLSFPGEARFREEAKGLA
jgi:succinate dehydrogenase/fumarate reductase flavoprotein subunit